MSRRSNRGKERAHPELTIDEMRKKIKLSLKDQSYESLGYKVLQFDSKTQRPRHILQTQRVGVHGNLNDIKNDIYLVEESLNIVHFIKNKVHLNYPPIELWNWIAHTKGFDITMVYQSEPRNIVGVVIGFYWPKHNLYLSHLTGVRPDHQGTGFGEFMRRKQLERLKSRIPALWQQYNSSQAASSSQPPPNSSQSNFVDLTGDDDNNADVNSVPPYKTLKLRVLTLSAQPDTGASASTAQRNGAVGFNKNVFLEKLGWIQDTSKDRNSGRLLRDVLLEALDAEFPHLKLVETMKTRLVQPLLFIEDEEVVLE